MTYFLNFSRQGAKIAVQKFLASLRLGGKSKNLTRKALFHAFGVRYSRQRRVFYNHHTPSGLKIIAQNK